MKMTLIPFRDFYGEYHGHKVEHLEKLLPHLRSSSDVLIWTSGDSSLDNKYWFQDRQRAVGVYQSLLTPPTSICDVTYWLNYLAQERRTHEPNRHGDNIAAINTAVEATTLNERWYRLRPQDRFLRDNISSNDILIVSVGGNDIALAPTPCTIVSIAGLMCLPKAYLEKSFSGCSIPMDDYCFGCGPSLCSCAGSCPPCFGYFAHLFGTRVKKYIEALTSKTKPKKILVCMIYYPDETKTESWAGAALKALGYDSNPEKLQILIKKMFEEATSKIKIPGSEVIPVPLFNVLNGKNSQDYAYRVEPSAQGGRKMAEYLLDIIENPVVAKEYNTNMLSAPSPALIPDTSRT